MRPLANKFNELFSRQPEVLAAAPGRVNLIGEHVDFLDGFVLPFAIKDVTTIAIARNGTNKIRVASAQENFKIEEVSLQDLQPLTGKTWTRYPIGVIWALEIKDGLDVLIDGQVPLGAGLSSSAALEAAVGTALNHLYKLDISPEKLALLCQKAENKYVGMPCGIMDQSISIMGREGHALLLDCRDLSTEQIPFDIAPLGLELLVIDTQVHHELVDGGYAERRASCEKAVSTLGIKSLRDISVEDFVSRKSELDQITFVRAYHAVTEMRRVLDAVNALKKSDFVNFGKIVTEAHNSLRDNYTVSCPELDLAVEVSLQNGALGARMIGGGFGGAAIALLKSEDVELVKSQINQAFIGADFKAPRFFISTPAQGARVINY